MSTSLVSIHHQPHLFLNNQGGCLFRSATQGYFSIYLTNIEGIIHWLHIGIFPCVEGSEKKKSSALFSSSLLLLLTPTTKQSEALKPTMADMGTALHHRHKTALSLLE
jgi:hypothetical protein